MIFMLLDLGRAPFINSTTSCAHIWHASTMIELVIHVYPGIGWGAGRGICETSFYDVWVGGWMDEGGKAFSVCLFVCWSEGQGV